ncbi:MAG: 50S ribosomal protein L22 [Pseudonocardia sp.]|nr:50S ribosomal protein L22 [Pseudonocardia sp.]
MEVIARSRFIRRGPRKARLVADMVRGMRVEEALTALEFAPQHAAHDVAKTIRSAAANAEHNFELSRDELWLKTIMIDDGPTMKRIRPVSRGSAHQYFHRTCHITVVVEDREEETGRRRRRPQPARRPAEPATPEASVDEQELAAAGTAEPEEPAAAVETPATEAEAEEPEAEASTALPTDAEVEVPGEEDEEEAEGEDTSDADDESSPDEAPQGKGDR